MSQDLAGTGVETVTGSSRVSVLAFLTDPVSEQVLRDSLSEVVSNGLDLRRGTIRIAIGAMAKLPTPEVLVVDLSGENQPLQALGELSGMVEPGVRILAIGEVDDVDLYRQLTRELGVLEYIFKPITREAIARHFIPSITRRNIGDEASRGGLAVAVIGARGGVGATSIAANLAWYLGVSAQRHTVLVDTDMYLGTAAALLGGRTGPGLRAALEQSQPIDRAFVDAAVHPITDRLHLLAGEERLGIPLDYVAGAAGKLIELLRFRYNFIILDLTLPGSPWHRELLNFLHHRVIVMDPTLASIRDSLRLQALPNGPWQPQSPVLVLNRQGRGFGLTRQQIEAALKVNIDIAAPDLPKLFAEANAGAPAAESPGPFRQMIADLAREVGFASRDTACPPAIQKPGLAERFRKLARQRG